MKTAYTEKHILAKKPGSFFEVSKNPNFIENSIKSWENLVNW
jgi:hypothetical protein